MTLKSASTRVTSIRRPTGGAPNISFATRFLSNVIASLTIPLIITSRSASSVLSGYSQPLISPSKSAFDSFSMAASTYRSGA